MPKVKRIERILKAAGEKQRVIYKGVPIRLSADFSKETLQEVFQVMKSKDLQPRLLYPVKLSVRMEGQIKCFPEKVKLKEFIIKGTYLRKKKIKTMNINGNKFTTINN